MVSSILELGNLSFVLISNLPTECLTILRIKQIFYNNDSKIKRLNEFTNFYFQSLGGAWELV